MKRVNKSQSSLFYERHLFFFYLKKSILSVKFIVCVILLLIPIFQLLYNLEFMFIENQRGVDKEIFWINFTGISDGILLLTSVIMAADIVSGEFSNRSAMIVYATESRYKILTIKSLCLIISIFILMLFYFSAIFIMIFIKTDLLVSTHIYIAGFLLNFIEMMVYSSLTFMISALTRSISLSFIFPFFYILIDPFLEILN
ncbi:hypothetical protein LCGC14_0723790 [marine sediment metagenome]|uniref:ABC-2 type transporter domain-containing protein n=1 Tax=marine sediment metagenome TaxID=412755 RepID=A0A0F9TIW9_9ZZZZ